jgi:hypothetical protein
MHSTVSMTSASLFEWGARASGYFATDRVASDPGRVLEYLAAEAALRNFTTDEAQGRQLAGNRLVDTVANRAGLPSAGRFAGFCRTLDLGGQYQRHLASVLQPPGQAGRQVRELLAGHQRRALRVEAHIARLKGELDIHEQQLLIDLCADKPADVAWRPGAGSVA